MGLGKDFTAEGHGRRWEYEPATKDGEGRLSFMEDSVQNSNQSWVHISTKSIVAVFSHRTEPDGENADSLLYATRQSNHLDAHKPEASPQWLELILDTNLPSKFMDDFQMTTDPALLQSFFPEDDKDSNLHVIISTHSGTHQAEDVWEKLVKRALIPWSERPGMQPVFRLTNSETSVADFVQTIIFPKANAGVETAIILLSGDGGLVDTINALLSKSHGPQYTNPTVALIPIGTGNAMAHSAGVTADDTVGLSALFRGKSRPVPIFTATFSPGARLLANEARDELPLEGHDANGAPLAYGAVVCSWGLHASLVADSDTAEYRKHGAERFKMAANEALFPSDGSMPHSYRGKVKVLKVESSGDMSWTDLPSETHGYVLATLVSRLEAGFTISPASEPLDGKLRLVHFGAVSGQEAIEIMTAAYGGGKHVEDERVGYEEIAGLQIHFDEEDGRWRRVCIDGKIIKVEKGGWVELKMGQKGVVDLLAM